MSNRVFVDTLFVVALVNRRDQYHAKAVELADQFENHPLLITDAVLIEIASALARKYKKDAIEVIEHSLASEEVKVVRLTSQLFDRAFDEHKKFRDNGRLKKYLASFYLKTSRRLQRNSSTLKNKTEKISAMLGLNSLSLAFFYLRVAR
jgi:predicted nucleic acid-binding protein